MREKAVVEVVYLDRKLIILKAKIIIGDSYYTSFFRVRKFPKNWLLNKFQTSIPEEITDKTKSFKIDQVIKLKKINIVFKNFKKESIKYRKKVKITFEILAFLAYLNNKQEEFNKYMIRTFYVRDESLYYDIVRDKFDDLEHYDTTHRTLEEWMRHV